LNAESRAELLARRRADLMAEIEVEASATASFTGRKQFSPAVMGAMSRVPRHLLIPPELENLAYINSPLSIGFGQTISQPYIVALMTDLLELRPEAIVLEIGCGSGYQAAVLAELSAKVYSIELVDELALRARSRLQELGYANVEVISGDGYYGCPEHAPFDGIIVTAAPDHVPPALVEQLKPGGRLVIPVGTNSFSQELLLIRKEADGRAVTRRTIAVRFVPLTRER